MIYFLISQKCRSVRRKWESKKLDIQFSIFFIHQIGPNCNLFSLSLCFVRFFRLRNETNISPTFAKIFFWRPLHNWAVVLNLIWFATPLLDYWTILRHPSYNLPTHRCHEQKFGGNPRAFHGTQGFCGTPVENHCIGGLDRLGNWLCVDRNNSSKKRSLLMSIGKESIIFIPLSRHLQNL